MYTYIICIHVYIYNSGIIAHLFGEPCSNCQSTIPIMKSKFVRDTQCLSYEEQVRENLPINYSRPIIYVYMYTNICIYDYTCISM